MKFHPSNLFKVTLLTLVLIFSFSCNKDSDLLAEFVVEKPQGMLINDIVVTLANQPIVIKPSVDDTFEKPENIIVTGTTPPSMGSTVINGDNTITYTPNPDKTGTDEFDYTANITNPDNTVTTETGKVTVTVTDKGTTTKPTDMGELKAFPGAEGFGKNATGGRGGKIVEVTTTNFSGPGSLKQALEMKGARTIVFRVGGTIQGRGNEFLHIPAGSGNVTIAGETAPGEGILIRGAKLSVKASNVIIRHIRFRQDPGTSTGGNDDAVTIDGTGSSTPLKDIIIDHCSFSWGLDGNLDIRNTWGATVQNSIMTGCIKSNLINANSKNISYIKNIFGLVSERALRAGEIYHSDLAYEMINNYLYGVNAPAGASQGLKTTTENNICEASSSFSNRSNTLIGFIAPEPGNTVQTSYYYIKGNDLGDAYANAIKSGTPSRYVFDKPLYRSTYNPVPTSGLKTALLANAGAYNGLSQGLDAVDVALFKNINAKTGKISARGTFPVIKNGTPYPDADRDGMDDNWEIANNLNPKDSSDGQKDRNGDGYTNLEEFLYYLTIK